MYISGRFYVFVLHLKRSEVMLETSCVIKFVVFCYESCAYCSMLVFESFYEEAFDRRDQNRFENFERPKSRLMGQ